MCLNARELADAVSVQAVVANRAWLVLMTVAVATVAGDDVEGKKQLPFDFGTVPVEYFYPAAFLLLVVLIIYFSAASAQQARADRWAQAFVNQLAESWTQGNDPHPRDVFDMHRRPSINRVASLAQLLRGEYQYHSGTKPCPIWRRRMSSVYYALLKAVSLLVYDLAPAVALVYAFARMDARGAILWIFAAGGLVAALTLLQVVVLDIRYLGRIYGIMS